jgi:hypothetical protein
MQRVKCATFYPCFVTTTGKEMFYPEIPTAEEIKAIFSS